MNITYQAEDGYVGGARPLHCNINDDEIRDCATLEETMKLVEEIVQEDFLQKVSPDWDYEQVKSQVLKIRLSQP